MSEREDRAGVAPTEPAAPALQRKSTKDRPHARVRVRVRDASPDGTDVVREVVVTTADDEEP